MDFQHILVKEDKRIGYLTLNRPEVLNSFNEAMHVEVATILDLWAHAPDIKVIVISGAGKGFCAGQDLNARKQGVIDRPDYDAGAALEHFYNPLMIKITEMPKPVIAAVNGVAAGAGANIALACDVVVAKQSAAFIQSFAKVGLIPDAGGTWILPRLVGQARAKGLTLLGDRLSATQALNWGMIWDVFADQYFEQEVINLAERLVLQPSSSMALIKKSIHLSWQNTLDEQLNVERDFQRLAGRSDNYKEGVTVFMQKRTPHFN